MDWLMIPRQLHVETMSFEDGIITVLASTNSSSVLQAARTLHAHEGYVDSGRSSAVSSSSASSITSSLSALRYGLEAG